MKALVYGGPRTIDYATVPDPEPANTKSAVVRVSLCGICGSDLHPYHKDSGTTGYCIGHEAVGEVVEVGSAVQRFKVGDRVLVCGSVSCGACAPCRRGEVLLCTNHDQAQIYGQGMPGLGGCQAEAIAVNVADENLWRLPDHISDEVGIMLSDNLGTAWYCARRARIAPGDTVAVIGLGAVGLQCVMAALAMGAARVFAIDLIAGRRAVAATLGAEPIDDPDAVGAIRDLTGGMGADVILDANGSAVTTKLAIRMLKRGGRVSVVGVSEDFIIPFPILTGLAKNLEFHIGLCSIQAEIAALSDAIESGRLDTAMIGGIITHRMKLSEGAAAYALFDARADGIIKIALNPGD